MKQVCAMDKIPLPRPVLKGRLSVEEAIYDRISQRNLMQVLL
jgi:hypothetical protein